MEAGPHFLFAAPLISLSQGEDPHFLKWQDD